MLSNERIKEAETNVKSHLSDGLIKKEKFRSIVFDTYMRNHRESLLVARKLHNENLSNLWVVVISYYSMFYLANALLYKMGYKIGSRVAHKVASDALIVFVRNKLKDKLIEDYELASGEALMLTDNLLQSFDNEREKRSIFQYESTEEIKAARAKTSLDRAEEFGVKIELMLIDKKIPS
ncbi:MAG TPA: hypothetical protein VJI46_03370 [Candidatus Nanoarchaeia archaeon]|nr:hypothetical protein [Candidatus Nanoarchaeia archaeon]